MIEKTLIGITVIVVVIGILIFRPVPIVTEDKALVVNGTVTGIYEGGIKDVIFKLQEDSRLFYINRGLENGLNLDSLRKNLIGEQVVIKYPSYWTPLDWDEEIRHLSKLEHKGEVIFNELAAN